MKINKNFDLNRTDYENLKISDLKSMADHWLRKYLLHKAERNGRNEIYCPIKNKWFSEGKMHVAHFVDRARMCTRYDLDNCRLISEQSNLWDAQIPYEGYKSKHHYDYEILLGEKKVKKLFALSKSICIFARRDYIEIIEKYRHV